MMSSMDTLSPAFQQVVELLLADQDLRRQGLADSPQAEELAMAMDLPWSQLTETEMKRAHGISADLFALGGEERLAPVPAAERSEAWLRPRLTAAGEQGDWWRLLELLRHGGGVTQRQCAISSGPAYDALSLPVVGGRFYELAGPMGSVLAMCQPLRSGDHALALSRARAAVKTEPPATLAVLTAIVLLAEFVRRGWRDSSVVAAAVTAFGRVAPKVAKEKSAKPKMSRRAGGRAQRRSAAAAVAWLEA